MRNQLVAENCIYLPTHGIHNRRTSIPPVGFQVIISADELLQTYSLDRAVTGLGKGGRYNG
jgi:hypothetical protein